MCAVTAAEASTAVVNVTLVASVIACASRLMFSTLTENGNCFTFSSHSGLFCFCIGIKGPQFKS